MRALHSPGYKRFAAFLAQVRQEAGITQQVLAKRLQKPQSFVSKVERCERRLDVPEFILLARALGHEPADLLVRIDALISGRGRRAG